MPNIASVLNAEIRRLARKEARAETAGLKKAIVGYRAEIAALKRRSLELERTLRQGSRTRTDKEPTQANAEAATAGRYSPKSLASQRKRLGLSASELAQLIGVSTQSIYNWEDGKARPHAKYLPAVFALKTLGRRAASAHLESLAANSEREAA